MSDTPTILGISMGPQKNRRLLVATTYVILATWMTGPFIAGPSLRSRIGPLWAELLLIILAIVLVMSASVFSRLVKPALSGHRSGEMTNLGLKPGPRGPDDPDEREVAIRNAAHYQAFRVIALYSLVLVGVSLLLMLLRDLSSSTAVLLALVAILILVLMTSTLPQAIILWTEPDAPEEDRAYNLK